MLILFLIFPNFSQAALVNFNFNLSCALNNSTWCFLALFLEYDAGIFGYSNYDYVLFSSRVCFTYSNPKPIKEQREAELIDGFGLPFTHYEVVLGIRHNCTENGTVYDYMAYEDDVRIETDEFDVKAGDDLTELGKAFEENPEVAWSRSKFEGNAEISTNFSNFGDFLELRPRASRPTNRLHLHQLPHPLSILVAKRRMREQRAVDAAKLPKSEIGCAEEQRAPQCEINSCYHKKYRSADGTCNNLAQPVNGAAFTRYLRMLPAVYDDGFNSVVSSINRNRPNPREVSMFLLSTDRTIPTHVNSIFMAFGQLFAHDVTQNTLINSCTCQMSSPQCANIPAPSRDPLRRCHQYTRSHPICGTGRPGLPREQLNMNTAAIDASSIYGSESITARTLRFGAMLRSTLRNGKVFPPISGGGVSAGDDRANIFVSLAALHTSFLRLHNTLAARLQNMNRNWTPDRIFQETRKILGAVTQVITFQEFLPDLIGDDFKSRVGSYDRYDANAKIGIFNEFAAAGFRLHGMIQERYVMKDQFWRVVRNYGFNDGVTRIDNALNDLDGLYRGLMGIATRSPQRLTPAVTEFLFGGSTDLASINIQRGRDHGLQSYNAYRTFCGLGAISSFDTWQEVKEQAVRERVKQLYRTPENLDLYVGGLLEEPKQGSLVGPTFSCIIAHQMKNLRDADRFWFENPGVFTNEQVVELRKASLAWILCLTGDNMTSVPRRAFAIESGSTAVPCSSIPQLNLSAWRE
ncbi:unnamed protein product [Caenorhabditis angaria]|uniref:peroxidase n=1 Tax=Caenorhabditis angaria TaxID=860376 RepID=A0A9P1N0Y4_9PELO|nr:unnamed protein product [Caenorhabditis angaria]